MSSASQTLRKKQAATEAAAEAKKAEGASCTALRRPKPPDLTGRDACNHAASLTDRLTLQMRRKETWGCSEEI